MTPPFWLPLRARLTLWYGALLAVTLVGFSALVYLTLERSLYSSVDEALDLRADQIRRELGPGIRLLQPEDVPPQQVEANPLEEFAAPGIYVQVLNARGRVVFAPTNLPGGELPVREPMVAALQAGQEAVWTVEAGGANVRVMTAPLRSETGQIVGAVQVGQSLSPAESTLAAVSRLLFVVGAAALLLALVVGWLLTRRALGPIARITETARHIARTGDYRQRLQVARHPGPGAQQRDELTFLAATFNDMIGRLEQLLESQRRLLADTSHELRNPLTVIRGNLALLRREGVPAESRREAVQEAEAEADRMGRLVNDLLLLARADAGQGPVFGRETVDLGAVAAEVVEQARSTAAAPALSLEVGSAPVRVLGDRDRLKQLVANLVDNAVRYTPPDGSIRVRVEPLPLQQPPAPDRSPFAAGAESPPPSMPSATTTATSLPLRTVALTVADTGIGIAAQHLPYVFERFYRADRARTRADLDTAGTGLGLSIAQYITQAHGGRIEASSDGIGQGSTFRVLLPALEALADAPREAPSAGPVHRAYGNIPAVAPVTATAGERGVA